MTYRTTPAKFLSLLALAAMVMPSANAGILGTSSSGVSLGDLPTYDDSEKFTSEDLAVMRESRTEARAKLKALGIAITEMEARLKAGDKTATQAKLDKLKQEKADATELVDALSSLILQAKADIKDTTPDIDTGYTDTGSSGSGGGGTQSIGEMLKQAAINGLLQNMLGGNNSALNGMMNNLQTSMNNLTGGLTGGTGGIPVNTGPQETPDVTVTEDTPEGNPNGLPDCAPEEEEKKDNSPGRRNAETGSTTGSKSTGSTTDTNPGKAKDDVITKPAPATRDDSGKLVKDKPKTDKKDEKKKECNPVDVTKKNPISKGTAANTGDAVNMYGVKSIEDAKKLIEANGGNCSTTKANGLTCTVGGRTIGVNAQCAAFPRTEIPHGTPSWRQGDIVDENTPVGSWVATFNNGDKYGPDHSPVGDYGYSHTGMYLGRTSDGSIILLDQFKKGKLNIRTYSCNGGLEGCDKYYTIRHPGTAWLKPLLQPYQLAREAVIFAKTLLIG